LRVETLVIVVWLGIESLVIVVIIVVVVARCDGIGVNVLFLVVVLDYWTRSCFSLIGCRLPIGIIGVGTLICAPALIGVEDWLQAIRAF
jgi:hypothetical protein